MENKKQSVGLIVWLSIILLSIIWGSSFMLIKKSLLALNPYEVGAMRILITGISMSPALWIFRRFIDWKKWPFFLLVGMTGSGLPSILYPMAETHINSSLAGVLNSLAPMFTLIFSVALFKNASNKNQFIGVILGFIGAIIMILFNGNSYGTTHILYASLVLIATMLYGMNANLVKHFFQETKAVIITALSFGLLMPFALAYILKMNTIPNLLVHPDGKIALLAVSVLALVGTSFATFLFFRVLQKTDAVLGASVAYMVPIVAIGLGLLDGEHFETNHIIGTILILFALRMISKK